jgi:hypothetical protein
MTSATEKTIDHHQDRTNASSPEVLGTYEKDESFYFSQITFLVRCQECLIPGPLIDTEAGGELLIQGATRVLYQRLGCI